MRKANLRLDAAPASHASHEETKATGSKRKERARTPALRDTAAATIHALKNPRGGGKSPVAVRAGDAPTATTATTKVDASGAGTSNLQPTNLALVNADVKGLLAKKSVTETDVMMMIRKWEDGALVIGEMPAISRAITATLKSSANAKALSAGSTRLLAYAQGRGGGGVLFQEPKLEATNRSPKSPSDFGVYRFVAGHAFLTPDASDVNVLNDAQGDEGDCFLLAVQAAMSSNQMSQIVIDQMPLVHAKTKMDAWQKQGFRVANADAITAAIKQLDTDHNAQGSLFFCRFFEEVKGSDFGKPVYVAVDHEFPVDPGDPTKPQAPRSFMFARNANDALHLAVFEKGFATLMGSWKAIDGGDSADAMFRLFGIKGKSITIKDAGADDALYGELDKALHGSPKRIVASGTPTGPENSKSAQFQKSLGADFEKMRRDAFAGGHVDAPMPSGVIPSHEYTIFDVAKTQAADGSTKMWVKLRNPWGDTVPDNLDPDSPDAKDTSLRQKGFFWLSMSEYRTFFEDIAIQRFADDPDLKGSKPDWFK